MKNSIFLLRTNIFLRLLRFYNKNFLLVVSKLPIGLTKSFCIISKFLIRFKCLCLLTPIVNGFVKMKYSIVFAFHSSHNRFLHFYTSKRTNQLYKYFYANNIMSSINDNWSMQREIEWNLLKTQTLNWNKISVYADQQIPNKIPHKQRLDVIYSVLM